MLAALCHKNVPWLYGVCNEAKHHKVIAMSHHSIDRQLFMSFFKIIVTSTIIATIRTTSYV